MKLPIALKTTRGSEKVEKLTAETLRSEARRYKIDPTVGFIYSRKILLDTILRFELWVESSMAK